MSGVEAVLIVAMLPMWWGSMVTRWMQVPFWSLVATLAVVSQSWRSMSFDMWGIWLVVGTAVGVVTFFVSIMLLGNPFSTVVRMSRRLPNMFLAHARRPLAILYYVGIATSEEFVVRVTLQTAVLGGGPAAILATSLLFAAVHWRPGRRGFSLELFELLVFSCVMGVLFDLTHSLPLVVAAHAVRNLNVAYVRGTTVDRSRVANPGVHGQEA